MNTRYIYATIAVLILLAGCAAPQATTPPETNGLTVAATFYPLYDLTKSIVGDQGTTYSIVPSGVEPHDYEPSPSDIQRVHDADAFVAMGIEFEEFEEDIIDSLDSSITVIHAGEGIALIEHDEDEHDHHEDEHDEEHDEEEHLDEHDHDEEHEDHDEEHDDHEEKHMDEDEHDHGLNDPHIWLSPRNAQQMARTIMKGLAQVNPADAAVYMQNGNALIASLQTLDQDFVQGLASCAQDTIIVNHNAFAYLARDYGFSVIGISGLEPEAEPTPQQLATLVEEANEHNLKYIFYEELVDPRIATTIAKEVGADTLLLSPLEGTKNPDATYDSLMRQNLANLRVALECQ